MALGPEAASGGWTSRGATSTPSSDRRANFRAAQKTLQTSCEFINKTVSGFRANTRLGSIRIIWIKISPISVWFITTRGEKQLQAAIDSGQSHSCFEGIIHHPSRWLTKWYANFHHWQVANKTRDITAYKVPVLDPTSCASTVCIQCASLKIEASVQTPEKLFSMLSIPTRCWMPETFIKAQLTHKSEARTARCQPSQHRIMQPLRNMQISHCSNRLQSGDSTFSVDVIMSFWISRIKIKQVYLNFLDNDRKLELNASENIRIINSDIYRVGWLFFISFFFSRPPDIKPNCRANRWRDAMTLFIS